VEFLVSPIGRKARSKNEPAGYSWKKQGYVFNRPVKYARLFSGVLDRLEPVFVDSQVGDLGLKCLSGDPK
jgi:hypothetical protein